MLKLIMHKELRSALRNRQLLITFLSLFVMLGIAFTGARWQYRKVSRERAAADEQFRRQWDQLQAYNPHSAAHYGTWLFKPLTVLSGFDKGVSNVTGYALRIEAHAQHNLAAAPVRPADNYLRFGELTMAVVLQLFFPLFIIFFCYHTYTRERESGTLRLILLQGGHHSAVIKGKAGLALMCITGIFLLNMLLYLPLLFMQGEGARPADIAAVLLLTACYAMYLGIFVLLAVIISVTARNSRQALFILLGIWLMWNMLIPRLTAAIGENRYPLPGQHVFEEKVSRATREGIDGKTPRQNRADKLTRQLLDKYNVQEAGQLPVNLSGLLMQAEEDYGQMVYETCLKEVDSIIRRQNNITAYAAIADPYLAIRNISMALSGTGYYHQSDFAAAARRYRNQFIRRLNEKMAYGGSKTGDFEWKADQAFFRSMPAFSYHPPPIGPVLRDQLLFFIVLLVWLSAGIFSLNKLAAHEPVV